jgi:hypothetical protein
MKMKIQIWTVLLVLACFSCTDNDDEIKDDVSEGPQLIIKFKFDPTQVRLNNIGQPATVPAGHAAQSPIFNSISSHYVELAQTATTQLGTGKVIYHGAETFAGGPKAIDFSKAKIVSENEAFLSISLSELAGGNYEWIRVSLSYQNYKINIWQSGTNYEGTLASFVGFNTYITSHNIGALSFPVNDDKEQGYWALNVNGLPFSGQAPENATTVPNPLSGQSDIPLKSCVVTGKFPENLVITGNETRNIEMTLSLSINNSFEWQEVTADGKFEPSAGENVVDMGLRGLIPTYVK